MVGFYPPQGPVIRIVKQVLTITRVLVERKCWASITNLLKDDKDNPTLYNNNFDALRDSVMTMEVTLDDDGADVNV